MLRLLIASALVFVSTEAHAQKASDRLPVIQAERIVREHLKDGKSAQFRGSYKSKKGFVCGEVNAKNSFGAYAGHTRFISRGRSVVMDDGSHEFSNAWSEMC